MKWNKRKGKIYESLMRWDEWKGNLSEFKSFFDGKA